MRGIRAPCTRRRPSDCSERQTVASAGQTSGRPLSAHAFCPKCAVPPLGLRNGPSRSTRITRRPSTRAGRVSGFAQALTRAATVGTSWRRITMSDPLSFSALVVDRLGRAARNRLVAPRRVPEHRRRRDLERSGRAGKVGSTGSRWILEAARSRASDERGCVEDDGRRRQLADGPGRPRLWRDRDRSERPGNDLCRHLHQWRPPSSRASTTDRRGRLQTRASSRR